jgi:hypothetical protein
MRALLSIVHSYNLKLELLSFVTSNQLNLLYRYQSVDIMMKSLQILSTYIFTKYYQLVYIIPTCRGMAEKNNKEMIGCFLPSILILSKTTSIFLLLWSIRIYRMLFVFMKKCNYSTLDISYMRP